MTCTILTSIQKSFKAQDRVVYAHLQVADYVQGLIAGRVFAWLSW
jgi:hypothetical protein